MQLGIIKWVKMCKDWKKYSCELTFCLNTRLKEVFQLQKAVHYAKEMTVFEILRIPTRYTEFKSFQNYLSAKTQ